MAKEAFKLRAEIVERSFAHNLDRGGMRRTWLRGRENVHKRYLLHVAGHNLSLLMRQLIGAGTPREAVAGGYGGIFVLLTPTGAMLVALGVSQSGQTVFAAAFLIFERQRAEIKEFGWINGLTTIRLCLRGARQPDPPLWAKARSHHRSRHTGCAAGAPGLLVSMRCQTIPPEHWRTTSRCRGQAIEFLSAAIRPDYTNGPQI